MMVTMKSDGYVYLMLIWFIFEIKHDSELIQSVMNLRNSFGSIQSVEPGIASVESFCEAAVTRGIFHGDLKIWRGNIAWVQ